MTLWIGKKFCLTMHQVPAFRNKPVWQVWDNGGRLPGETFDLNFHLSMIAVSFTWWNMSRRVSARIGRLPKINWTYGK